MRPAILRERARPERGGARASVIILVRQVRRSASVASPLSPSHARFSSGQIVIQIQFLTKEPRFHVYRAGCPGHRPAISLRKVGTADACATQAIPREPPLSAYSLAGFS